MAATPVQVAQQQWEYFYLLLKDTGLLGPEKVSAMLNLYGRDGWELTSVTPREAMGQRLYELWFKRPVAPQS